jgi:hypothetical protein
MAFQIRRSRVPSRPSRRAQPTENERFQSFGPSPRGRGRSETWPETRIGFVSPALRLPLPCLAPNGSREGQRQCQEWQAGPSAHLAPCLAGLRPPPKWIEKTLCPIPARRPPACERHPSGQSAVVPKSRPHQQRRLVRSRAPAVRTQPTCKRVRSDQSREGSQIGTNRQQVQGPSIAPEMHSAVDGWFQHSA